MSDFIKIGKNFIRKNKIYFAGIDSMNIDNIGKKNTILRIEISGNKTINIPFKTKEEAEKELKRVQKELDETEIKSIRDLVEKANQK